MQRRDQTLVQRTSSTRGRSGSGWLEASRPAESRAVRGLSTGSARTRALMKTRAAASPPRSRLRGPHERYAHAKLKTIAICPEPGFAGGDRSPGPPLTHCLLRAHRHGLFDGCIWPKDGFASIA